MAFEPVSVALRMELNRRLGLAGVTDFSTYCTKVNAAACRDLCAVTSLHDDTIPICSMDGQNIAQDSIDSIVFSYPEMRLATRPFFDKLDAACSAVFRREAIFTALRNRNVASTWVVAMRHVPNSFDVEVAVLSLRVFEVQFMLRESDKRRYASFDLNASFLSFVVKGHENDSLLCSCSA